MYRLRLISELHAVRMCTWHAVAAPVSRSLALALPHVIVCTRAQMKLLTGDLLDFYDLRGVTDTAAPAAARSRGPSDATTTPADTFSPAMRHLAYAAGHRMAVRIKLPPGKLKARKPEALALLAALHRHRHTHRSPAPAAATNGSTHAESQVPPLPASGLHAVALRASSSSSSSSSEPGSDPSSPPPTPLAHEPPGGANLFDAAAEMDRELAAARVVSALAAGLGVKEEQVRARARCCGHISTAPWSCCCSISKPCRWPLAPFTRLLLHPVSAL